MTDSRDRRAPGWTPDLTTFGARLALVRQHMGWGNVKQAAELCAIPVQTWRTWERDGMVPRNYMNACMKIAGVTGVDLNWLAVGPMAAAPARVSELAEPTHGYSPVKLGSHVVATVPRLPKPVARADVRTIRTSPISR